MSSPKLFDVHTHIQFAAFKEDADFVIKRALEQGVWIINVGTQRDTSANALSLAEKFSEGVYATVGLHPIHTEKSYHDPAELGHDPQELGLFSSSQEHENKEKEGGLNEALGFTSRGEDFDYNYYKKLAEHKKVVAIGECGLDYYRIKSQESRIKQEKAFGQQIELAAELKKPLMIHCRQAFPDLIDVLQTTNYKLQPSIVHFFSGTKEDAKKLLDLGFSFSLGGVITFARDYDEVIKYIPLDRILLETDAPYVAPIPYRGKRNEPIYIMEVAKKMSELKDLSFDEICATTKENTVRIFAIK